LLNLFDRAVAEYRDRLRTKVQDDATAIFRQLTTEADYDRLSINENYGLTIVHRDGQSIPVRSAGAEHIVALSLMGALQRNAPLRGPIIMDSPFGRLDEGHTTRVVRTLPSMADQVLLLVYENELDPRLARNELKARLRREYRLVRKTARHSNIEPITE
jgi:DNA sulfur modification protein DndD